MVVEICYFGLQKDLKKLKDTFYDWNARKTSWLRDLFIFKDSTFAAVDLSHLLSVSVQDYCDKQHWGGEETGKK